MSEKRRCSLCGASRMDNGACSLLGCRDPLFDQRAEEAIAAAEERGRRRGVEEERAMWQHSRFAIAILVQRLGGDALITKSEMVRLDGRTVIETSTEPNGLRIRVCPPEDAALAPRDSGKEG